VKGGRCKGHMTRPSVTQQKLSERGRQQAAVIQRKKEDFSEAYRQYRVGDRRSEKAAGGDGHGFETLMKQSCCLSCTVQLFRIRPRSSCARCY
jgi:hypothetical protein